MFKKLLTSLVLIGILLTNLGSVTFANSTNSEDGVQSVGTPGYYEFKSTTRNFTKTTFAALHAKAYKAANGVGTGAFVDLGLYIIGKLGYSSITTRINYKRFWTGQSYLPWYAYGSPIYVRSNY